MTSIKDLADENRQLRARIAELFDAMQRIRVECAASRASKSDDAKMRIEKIYVFASKVIEHPGSKE